MQSSKPVGAKRLSSLTGIAGRSMKGHAILVLLTSRTIKAFFPTSILLEISIVDVVAQWSALVDSARVSGWYDGGTNFVGFRF